MKKYMNQLLQQISHNGHIAKPGLCNVQNQPNYGGLTSVYCCYGFCVYISLTNILSLYYDCIMNGGTDKKRLWQLSSPILDTIKVNGAVRTNAEFRPHKLFTRCTHWTEK
uniref:Uncharacterized protein n=1 Tax=Glossina austeni TaxID=7395 RepID=A0A1A9VXE6_GLOAU